MGVAIGDLWETVRWALGLDPGQQPVWWQMGLRALVIFGLGLVVVRLGNRRFLARNTAFDMLLAVILGSVLSRAINGGAPFLETLVAASLLVALHWILAAIAFRSHAFGKLVKGPVHELIRDGEMRWDEMRKTRITEHDLFEALHTAHVSDVRDVKVARLERSGEISIIPRERTPQVVEISVEEGVKTVRVELT